MLSRIGDVLPRFHAYGRLFRTHEHVRHALSMVYLDIITFCSDAKRVFQEARKQRGTSEAYRNEAKDGLMLCSYEFEAFQNPLETV
jgi:hypothetical protein